MTGAGPLPRKRCATARRGATEPRGGHAAREGDAGRYNAVHQKAGRPYSPGIGSAARAIAPGRLPSPALGPTGQHRLVSSGCRIQCQAPGRAPGPVWGAPGERRGRGRGRGLSLFAGISWPSSPWRVDGVGEEMGREPTLYRKLFAPLLFEGLG